MKANDKREKEERMMDKMNKVMQGRMKGIKGQEKQGGIEGANGGKGKE